jgi:poly-gamma-glutamate capsule biosynthesis protein CapA/YwtB (metallophosphatase superfamily)
MEASVTLFLCGDVMTGRGIDQILPHPAELHLQPDGTLALRWGVERRAPA